MVALLLLSSIKGEGSHGFICDITRGACGDGSFREGRKQSYCFKDKGSGDTQRHRLNEVSTSLTREPTGKAKAVFQLIPTPPWIDKAQSDAHGTCGPVNQFSSACREVGGRRQGQEDQEFKANLSYMRPCLRKTPQQSMNLACLGK